MTIRRKYLFIVAGLALGLAVVLFLKPWHSGFNDSEVKKVEEAVNRRPRPDEKACVILPLDGTSREGPGTALLLEALSPDGPHKSCYDLQDRLSDLSELSPPATTLSEEGRTVWERYWQASDSQTEVEVRQRCDDLVRSVAKAGSYDEVCAPFSLDYMEYVQSVFSVERAAPLLLRSLMREGNVLEAAKLSLSLLHAKQRLGHHRATSVTALVAFSRSSVLSFLTEIVVSERLTEGEREVVQSQLLRLLKSIPSPSDHAAAEEAVMLAEQTTADCDTECRSAQFVLVAMRDTREVCRGLDYLACSNAWKTWADQLTEDVLPSSLPSIEDKTLRERLLNDVRGLARLRSQYTLKISQYYAALVALEMALRPQGQNCAQAVDNQLGVSLVLEKKDGWVSVALPQELQIRSTKPSAGASHLLSFRCAEVAQ